MEDKEIHGIFRMKILPIVLQFMSGSIEREIFNLKEYLLDINLLAIREKERLKEMIKKMVEESPDDSQEIYENYIDQFYVYEEKYIELSNNSLLVTAYSYFEHQLKEIDSTLPRYLTKSKGRAFKNPKWSYAKNLKNNIYKMTALDFKSIESDWRAIDEFRKIRNLIVHNGSNLIEKENRFIKSQTSYKLISNTKEIKLDEKNGDFYIADKELVFKFLDLTEKYLLRLINILSTLDKDDII